MLTTTTITTTAVWETKPSSDDNTSVRQSFRTKDSQPLIQRVFGIAYNTTMIASLFLASVPITTIFDNIVYSSFYDDEKTNINAINK